MGLDDGYAGGIYCIQSQGSLFNYHPHSHALVPAGIMKNGTFHEQTNISTTVIAKIFRARLLTILLAKGVITQELIDMLMTWNHNSGFNVHTRGRISGDDGDAIENIARYMSRAAISVERVEFNPDENSITVYEKQDRTSCGMTTTYTMMEFMALLAGHTPSPYEPLVYYYGIYSSSWRGKEKRENADKDKAPEVEEIRGISKASSTWARLIRKIFEVDVLRCKKCGGEMKVIAFITEEKSVRRILNHIGEQTQRGPPLRQTHSPAILTDADHGDDSPPVEVYAHDPQYIV